MTRISRILFATDLNADSANAVGFVSSLARQLGAELHLLCVIPGSTQSGERGNSPPAPPDDVQSQLDRLTLTASMNRVTTVSAVRRGRPAEEIAAYAKAMEIGLVAMGSRGRTHLAQALLGSVAEQVIRTAPCPVLVLPPNCFKLNGRRLLHTARLLAAEFGPGVVGGRDEGRARLMTTVETREQLNSPEADWVVQALERAGAIVWHAGQPEDGPKSQFWAINPDVLEEVEESALAPDSEIGPVTENRPRSICFSTPSRTVRPTSTLIP